MANARAPRFSIRILQPGSQEPVSVLDITSRLVSLKYVDSEKKADAMTLTLSNRDLRFPDDPMFQHGAVLYARWGSEGLGPERICTVQKWTAGYDTFVVEAHGAGVTLNKTNLTEVWYQKSRSDIARILAKRYGYTEDQMFIDDTHEVYEIIQPRGKTAAQLLAAMAARESKNGVPFIFNANTYGFFFHARKYEQPSRRLYEWVGENAGALRDFPKFKASIQAKPGAVTVKGVDKTTGKPIEHKADDETTKGRPGFAAVKMTVNRKSGGVAFMQDVATETLCTTGAATVADAKKAAGAAFGKHSGMPLDCTATVDGDAFLEAKSVVTFEKIGRMLSGNYYVKDVTHTIASGDYTCELTCHRDGTNATGLTGAAAKAMQSSATKNDTAPAGGGDPGTPPDLVPRLQLNGRSGGQSWSYVPATGTSGSPPKQS